jgi:hypothetical protein
MRMRRPLVYPGVPPTTRSYAQVISGSCGEGLRDVLVARYQRLKDIGREVPSDNLTRNPHPRLLPNPLPPLHLPLFPIPINRRQSNLVRLENLLVESVP